MFGAAVGYAPPVSHETGVAKGLPPHRRDVRRLSRWLCGLALLASCSATGVVAPSAPFRSRIHYLEIVCRDVDAQCAALTRVHGWNFGAPLADLGGARVAKADDGSLVGVRAPLGEHEEPVVRSYVEVEDIARAVGDAEAAGAIIAYPPTRQGDTGTWAIHVLGDVQLGLWQRP